MALGQLQKNPQLLDVLSELNDLVLALKGGELKDALADLKKRTEDANNAIAIAEESSQKAAKAASDLESATDENNASALSLRKQRESLAAEKMENDKQLQKISAVQAAVDASRKEMEARHAAATSELELKSQALAEREKKVQERQKNIDLLREEYEKKLSDLKKITG
jgi:chromosome segregation ATPase